MLKQNTSKLLKKKLHVESGEGVTMEGAVDLSARLDTLDKDFKTLEAHLKESQEN